MQKSRSDSGDIQASTPCIRIHSSELARRSRCSAGARSGNSPVDTRQCSKLGCPSHLGVYGPTVIWTARVWLMCCKAQSSYRTRAPVSRLGSVCDGADNRHLTALMYSFLSRLLKTSLLGVSVQCLVAIGWVNGQRTSSQNGLTNEG